MGKLVRLLNTAAFCCSLGAAAVLLLHVTAWGGFFREVPAFNRTLSNLVAGYACLYGLSQWVQQKNRTLAVGLMTIGTLILAVNMATGGV